MNLVEFRKHCEQESYPIMGDDALDKILETVQNGDNVLELGTCVGYSSLYLAKHKDINIITLERDPVRYQLAVENLSNYKNIEVIFEDALNYQTDNLFDVIIFDAAKGQNLKFLEKYLPHLKENGSIFVDNIHFHGLVENSESIKHKKNLYSLVKKIQQFIDSVLDNKDLTINIFNVGDGLMMIKRKCD